jgi:large subunit ribosomal protein L24
MFKMKKDFSLAWISSKQRRKQRKYRANAPLHLKRKFVSANLAKNLREKHHKRSVPIRKGDSVEIMRGTYKGKSGKVDEVDIKNNRIFVKGVDFIKKDGSKVRFPLSPSNLQITSLVADDNRRFGMSEGKSKKGEEKKKESKKDSSEKYETVKSESDTSKTSTKGKSKASSNKKSSLTKKAKSNGKKTRKAKSGSETKKKGSKSKSGKTKTKKDSTKNSEASD